MPRKKSQSQASTEVATNLATDDEFEHHTLQGNMDPMTTSRREKIEVLLKDDPTDFYLRYSLAMELDKEGEHEQSLALFEKLIQEDPPHVPSFFMTGQQLSRLGRIEEARAILRDGIEMARAQNNRHAASEMSEFLASLGSAG